MKDKVVIITGTSSGGSGTSWDWATLKYSPTGDSLWVRRYNGAANGNDRAKALAVDDSGNVYVTGTCEALSGSAQHTTIKYSPAGDTLWVRHYTGPGIDYAVPEALAVDDSGNVYVTGRSWASDTQFDYITIEYSSSGDVLWMRDYDGPGTARYWDRSYALALNDSGIAYVTGWSDGIGTGLDFATIKYRSCPIRYVGDVTDDDVITSADAIALVNYVFKSGNVPLPCEAAGDENCDGRVTSSDIIYVVNHVFKGGPVPCDPCGLIPGIWSCP